MILLEQKKKRASRISNSRTVVNFVSYKKYNIFYRMFCQVIVKEKYEKLQYAEVKMKIELGKIPTLSALLRCVLLNIEKDYVEKKLEPYAIQCKYKVLKEDIENGIIIDFIPSKYRGDSDRIYDAKIKINDVEQNVEQIENPLQGVKEC